MTHHEPRQDVLHSMSRADRETMSARRLRVCFGLGATLVAGVGIFRIVAFAGDSSGGTFLALGVYLATLATLLAPITAQCGFRISRRLRVWLTASLLVGLGVLNAGSVLLAWAATGVAGTAVGVVFGIGIIAVSEIWNHIPLTPASRSDAVHE